ncbi:siderophore-iron reductase FhuF [Bordetella bronchialis]|uniref:siderophore-iron reductase FhuF n=1 Tax=Bordetella bronchialis TaxID=463025 RepID=UPI0009F58E86|nr:siderophore-iron reductase FhuF [Bordetella bronchialis]
MPYRLIAPLLPLFGAGLGRHARRVVLARGTPAPAGGGTLAGVLADPAALRRLLDAQARYFGSEDRVAVAAVWHLTYLERLIPPVAAAASVLDRVLPVGAGQLIPRWTRDGAAWRFAIPDDGMHMPGAPTTRRYATLLDDHLHPLAEALALHARLPRAVAWGNAARLLDMTLSRLARAMPHRPAILLDRQRLLESATLRGTAPNPMYRPPRHALRDGGPVTLLRRCCLYYRLPGHGYCDLCPLSPCNRRQPAS